MMNRRILRGGRILAGFLLMLCLLSSLFAATAFAASPGQAALTVRQVFNNSGASAMAPSETFTYRLTPKQASSPMPEGTNADGYVFTVTGTGSTSIGPISFTQMGKYTYELSHTTSPQSNYTYDMEVYTLEIWVDNSLNAAVVVYNRDGGKEAEIKYEHSYSLLPSDPAAMTDPPVVKTVSGSPSKNSTFTFQLVPGNPSNPMPAGSANGIKTLRIKGSGQGEFGPWSYTAEGTYFYTVYEVNTGLSGYIYDTTVYTITDSVKAVDGQLAVTRVVTNGANRQVTSLSFINTYTGGSEPGKPGKPGAPAYPGKPGPITGDEARTTLYIALISIAGIAALGSAVYLLAGRRRGRKHDEHES